MGRPAAVDAFDRTPRAIGFDHSRTETGGDPQRIHDAFRLEPEQSPGGSRGAKRAADRRRVPAALKEHVPGLGQITAHANSDSHFDAKRCSEECVSAGPPGCFSHGQHRRHDAGTRMQHRRQMRVVEVEAVREGAVDQCRIRRRTSQVGADQARFGFAAPYLDHLLYAVDEAKRSGRQTDAQCVQKPQFHAVDDLCGQAVERCLSGEVRQMLRKRSRHSATAIGRTGEPVAPTNFSGRHTNRNV